MLRLFAVSLVFLLASGTVWAQDSPVVNRLDVHPDWLFQPDRGWVSPPDTLDPWRYYPLAVGNAWEYRNMDNHTLRVDITRDSVIEDLQYFHWRRRWYNAAGQPTHGSVDLYIRYDTTSTYVLTSYLLDPYTDYIPCRFNAQPDTILKCVGQDDMGHVDWMTYEGVLEFSDTTVVEVPVKHYNVMYGAWRYAADFGEVWAWQKDGRPIRGLTFARIDGETFGTELFPYTVSNEPESPFNQEVAIEALWPNPARSSISLRLMAPEISQVHVNVFDLLGREVLVWKGIVTGQEETIELDLRTLPTGSYIARLTTENEASRGVLFTLVE